MKLILKNNLETHLHALIWFYIVAACVPVHILSVFFSWMIFNIMNDFWYHNVCMISNICSYKFLLQFNPLKLIHKFEIIKKMAINIKELKRSALINIKDTHMPAQFNFVFKYIPQVRRMSLRKKNHPRERPSSPPSPTSRCVLQKPSPDQPKVVHIFFFFF